MLGDREFARDNHANATAGGRINLPDFGVRPTTRLMPSARRFIRSLALGATVVLTVVACGEPRANRRSSTEQDEQPPWFADATAELELDFIHDPGPVDGK